MKNVLILWPRLDCSFKKGDVPAVEGPPNHPLRNHWVNFLNKLYDYHKRLGHTVSVKRAALWQFDLDTVKQYAKEYDLVYMPHKQKVDFDAGKNVLFYMQTVFPWMFTIDSFGWGASMSWSPVDFHKVINETLWKELERYRDTNQSKFPQPELKEIKDKDFFLFMCQLPHDETIKYHSRISVLDALKRTYEHSQSLGVPLIVKGHPANPGSMMPLINFCAEKGLNFTFDISIHDLFRKAKAVFTVNSGSGLEAMLHGKPIITYGSSEYGNAVFCDGWSEIGWIREMPEYNGVPVSDQLKEYLKTDQEKIIKTYKYFMTSFFEKCIDSGDLKSYEKVNGIAKNCSK